MIKQAFWIGSSENFGDIAPTFSKNFTVEFDKISKASVSVTCLGVYEAEINHKRIGSFYMAPGCTAYEKRIQFQTYDITDDLKSGENLLTVTVGTGWCRGRISKAYLPMHELPCAVIAALVIEYTDGSSQTVITDDSWSVSKSSILFSDIYDGELYDAEALPGSYTPACILELDRSVLIPQESEHVCEHERLKAREYIISPKGERILDFGQNMAGYIEFKTFAEKGAHIEISFAEVLDKEGNFYTENYRTAQSKFRYTACGGEQLVKPHFTFFGFRYIRLDSYPENFDIYDFTAVAIYTDMERTGYMKSANSKLNRYYENTLWSQRANFIDIPTDCPQRDERHGWTGDCQAFAKTACYNYNVKKMLTKWLHDVCAEQLENGIIPRIVPNFWKTERTSTAWGDAICIVPWQLFLAYGDISVLADCFDAMKKWVDYMTEDSDREYLWYTDKPYEEIFRIKHYGDWLALDAKEGSYTGSSDLNFISSAFYAHSTELLIKSGKALGRDMTEYAEQYEGIVKTFKKTFPHPKTQTEHILALHFNLTDDKPALAAALNDMVIKSGHHLITGFVGTPYLLHALSDNGYSETAYSVLLQEEYPSWLYSVNQGATSIWEHLDSTNDKGEFWSPEMNSYNHYCYGSANDFIYEKAAGITTDKALPGYGRAVIAPIPDKRLGWLSVDFKTAHGNIHSEWTYVGDTVRYEISTPVDAKIIINKREITVPPGNYLF